MTDYPSRLADKFMLRFPDEWRPVLKARAARNRRSMNSEIMAMIEPLIAAELDAGAKFDGETPALTQTE